MMKKIAQVQFFAEYNQLELVRQLVERHATELGIAPEKIYDLTWSITEIVTNIIKHGYKEAAGIIEIILWQREKDFIMQILDEAPVFDPDTVPEPNLTLPLDRRPLGGLGLSMTRKMLDSISHRSRKNGGNEITLVKRNVIAN